jgi:hypothetical protein
MTIILDEDSAPDSDSPDPEILKCSKLLLADREEVGWEIPEDWEYDNKTLAQKIAKLKRSRTGRWTIHLRPSWTHPRRLRALLAPPT